MQEIIKRVLEGNFDYENGSLDFSCAKLEITLSKGNIYEGSFHITSTQNCYTRGTITTSDIRMECLTPEFIGNDVEISFCFHGENMEEGDVVKGTFSIVSTLGEYSLPFVVSIEHTVLTSSIGNIKNLFHFANLAKSSWQEAVKLFYSADFPRILEGKDAQLYDTYRALSAYSGNEQNMEEFLIQINKKQKVEFLLSQEEIEMTLPVMESPYTVTETELSIVRNGWGYTALQVECEGDFVFTEKEVLTDDDFLGNQCRLPVYIDSSLCRRGKNFGMVYIYNSYVSMEIPVVVRLGQTDAARAVELSRKKMLVQLMELYQAFRLKKAGKGTWLKETGKLVVRLVALDEEDVAARLFQAQLLITEKRFHEAGWLLDHGAELMELNNRADGALWAYYLYLTTLIQDEEEYVDWVTGEVELIYKRNRQDWRVAWLLLYLSEEYNKSDSGKWAFLERQFQYGCNSPVLYIEALSLLNANPSVLRKLDGMGLQVLYYGARQEMLGSELVEQLLYLTGRVKEYSPLLEKILIMLYDKKADSRILQEICTLLIKGGKVGRNCFSWYAKGVDEQLRITNLYEHYMMSVDMQQIQEIPKIVLMYFMYQNNLDYERTAFLYYYVLRHRAEYGELYDNYRPRIERFVAQQIQKGRINRYLAGLYQEVLTPGIVTEQTAGQLAVILHTYQITVEDGRLRRVIVYQPGNELPTSYFLQDRRAWVAMYGNDNTVVFEDAWGNRFMKGTKYSIEKMMSAGDYLPLLAHYVKDSHGLDVYLCGREREEGALSPDTLERYDRLISSENTSVLVKRKAYMGLLQHYSHEDAADEMEKYLEHLPMEELSVAERRKVIRFLVVSGRCDRAYDFIAKYGPYFLDAKIVMRFADEMIPKMDFGEDGVLLAAALYAFKKGKYSSIIVQYLTIHFRGMLKELRDIWKGAKAFDLPCERLGERMLIQMLYSGAFIEEKLDIFRYYVSMEGNRELVEAVLSGYSYEFFVKEKQTEEFIFQEIYRTSCLGENVRWIEKLAFLKYYAENHDRLETQQKPLVELWVKEMLEKRIYLNFLREYKEFAYLQKELEDKVIIEYRSSQGGRPKLHYVMLHDNGESDEYISRYMQEVYPGMYFIDFVMFFGESLQYYIKEETEGEEHLTESGNIQKNDTITEKIDSRYGLINDIIISKSMMDYDTLDKLLREYYYKEFLNQQLFELK